MVSKQDQTAHIKVSVHNGVNDADKQQKTNTHTQPAHSMQSDRDEIGGPKGPEPTRYGDWEKGGRCIDF